MAITDKGLALAVENVRKALDTIPHGEAKKITNAIEALIDEASWLTVQRDRARETLSTIEAELELKA